MKKMMILMSQRIGLMGNQHINKQESSHWNTWKDEVKLENIKLKKLKTIIREIKESVIFVNTYV